ncbi:Uncharacterised protein [Halioglobus japonicus]|nr:Uncharacterised protein [Halioglobus japonicus]
MDRSVPGDSAGAIGTSCVYCRFNPHLYHTVAPLLQSNPEIASIHPMGPIGADEEILLLEHSLNSYVPNSFAHVPDYGRFVAAAGNTPANEQLKRQLQLLQWQKSAAVNVPSAGC